MTDPYPAEWPDWVRKNSTPRGDCILWDRLYYGRRRIPVHVHADGTPVNVKQLLMAEPEDSVTRWATSCDDGKCLTPAHQRWRFREVPPVYTVSGWAVVWDALSVVQEEPLGQWRDVYTPGSLTGLDDPATALTWGHEGRTLATVGDGSLTLTEAPEGVRFTATVPADCAAVEWLRQGRPLGASPFVTEVEQQPVVRPGAPVLWRFTRARLIRLALLDEPCFPQTLGVALEGFPEAA